MSDRSSEGRIIDLGPDEVKPVTPSAKPSAPEQAEQPQTPPESPPESADVSRATFLGNTYDLTAFAGLISGVIVLASCLTCNTIYWCLPLAPIVLGLIGVVSANQAVDARRTRTWSWIGIAAGVLFLLVVLAVIVLYVAFIVLMIYLGEID